MDLRRLRGYVSAKVFDSEERARMTARDSDKTALNASHVYSAKVGRQILEEIAELEARDSQ